MNQSRLLQLSFIVALSFTVHPLPAQKMALYVSLNGNDAWSGRLADPAKNKADGPFRTFERTLSALEDLNTKGQMPGEGATVFVREGIYAIGQPIILSDKHSGKNGASIVFKNYQQEKVSLTGGKEIKGFHVITDSLILVRIKAPYQKEILELSLRSQGIQDYGTITNRGRPGMELFYNNKKMEPARWPDTGWAKIADVPQTGELVNKGELPHIRFGLPVGKHYGRFTYEGDRPSAWSDIENISLHGYWVWDWYDEFLAIQSIDTATKEIFIKPPHSHYGICKDQRYYAANVLEELDRPGEWFLDRRTGKLFFWPPTPLNQGSAFVSTLDSAVIILDHTDNVRIEGLAIEFSRGSAIEIKGGKNNLVAGCSFNNLGDVAVNIDGGSKNGITSCDIYELAGGAVILRGGDRKTLEPAGNFVTNNHIHHTGQWLRTYPSAITISGVGNSIAHNLVHNAPGSGIWLNGNEHTIEYNEMHDLALETGDVGGFYMGRDWTERGNIIRYNYFHDLQGQGVHDVNAVYLDDWTSGTTVTGNIFARCARGIMIGGGRDNIVDNNIFMGCHPAVHIDSRGLGWAKYYFDGSNDTLFDRMDAMNYKQPPYSEKYPILLSLYNDEPAVAKNNRLTRNISYQGRWVDLGDGLDLTVVSSDHNLIGKPESPFINKKDHVINENPGIYNDAPGSFRLDVRAYKYGFVKIPSQKIGLQKDDFRNDPVPAVIIR